MIVYTCAYCCSHLVKVFMQEKIDYKISFPRSNKFLIPNLIMFLNDIIKCKEDWDIIGWQMIIKIELK